MMKKGFALTLMTVAIALVQVSTSHATAPVISNPGEVIIGDLEDRTDATSPVIFVAPDIVNADNIVSDDTTADADIKWSFYSATADIQINGVTSLDVSLAGLGDDDPTSPRAANRIDLNDGDAGGPQDPSDANPRTFTFRDTANNPGPGPDGVIDTNMVTLFASDCTTFSSRVVTVWTIRGESDGLSGAGPEVINTYDFTTSTFGWLGGNSPGFGGTTASGASGLCMTVPAAGSNLVLWISPDAWIELVDTAVYRSRVNASTDQAAVDAIPLWFHTFDNSTLAGGSADGSAYGGFEWVLDVDGGAQGVGRANGRTQYDFWWSVNAGGTPQFSAGAFTAGADAVNDARNGFQIIDANASLLTDADSGTICIEQLEVARILRGDIQVSSTPYNPPISSSATGVLNVFSSPGTTVTVDDANNEVDVDMGTAGDVRVDVFPFDPDADGVPGGQFGPLELYPVVWLSDTVYRTRSAIRAQAAGTDPVDAIFMATDVTNSELGAQSFTTRGPGASPLSGVSSPTTTSADYDITFGSQNATDSLTPNADRLRGFPFFFNTGNLFGAGTGGDAFEVESLETDLTALD